MTGEVPEDPFRDGRLSAPSALRNRDAIAAALAGIAPARGRALEIASGTGEHIVTIAPATPGLHWQPSDPAPERRASIAAWIAAVTGGGPAPASANAPADTPAPAPTPAPTIAAPIHLDACRPGWAADTGPQDLIFLANLLHLVTEAQAATCLTEMARALAPSGLAVVYGPFLRDGRTTSLGDAEFHARLAAATPGAGYKDLAWVHGLWTLAGLTPDPPRPMPANNLLLVARKSANPAVP